MLLSSRRSGPYNNYCYFSGFYLITATSFDVKDIMRHWCFLWMLLNVLFFGIKIRWNLLNLNKIHFELLNEYETSNKHVSQIFSENLIQNIFWQIQLAQIFEYSHFGQIRVWKNLSLLYKVSNNLIRSK